MSGYVLDTNVVAALVKHHSAVRTAFRDALRLQDRLYLCPVVLFEIERGLLAKPSATRQRTEFELLRPFLTYREFSEDVWQQAARLWALTVATGHPRSDADLLIAAFASVHQATLVTNNTTDFHDLGITLADWTSV